MRKLIQIAASYLAKANQYTTDEEERIEYAIRILFFEISKIIGVLIIFSLMGYSLPAVVAVFTIAICKPFIGGYHEDTQIKCFVTTLILIGSIIYLSTNLSLNLISKLVLASWSLYCIYHQAPVINPKMQLTKDNLIRRNRLLGMYLSIILVIISLILHKYVLISATILWTMVFQALLLFNKRYNG